MKTELYRVIKSIDKEALSEEDKDDLLKLFMVTNNGLIRDHIAILFSDVRYFKAAPYIIRKIKDKSTYGNTGVLVAALRNLDAGKYYHEFVNVICEQDYESRLWALDLIEDFISDVSTNVKRKALKTLTAFKSSIVGIHEAEYKNSRLHFIDEAIKLISNALNQITAERK
jgi:hypothetical protein